jgi:acetyl-CoA acetyltransferase
VTTPKAGPVERAVRSELRQLACSVQSDGSAALAVALARQIDTARGAVAAAAAAGQLRLLLDDLRKASAEKQPVRTRIDALRADELAERRRAAG